MELRDEEIPLRQAGQDGAEQAGRVAADEGGDDHRRIDGEKRRAVIGIAGPPLQGGADADRGEGDDVADRGVAPESTRSAMNRRRQGSSYAFMRPAAAGTVSRGISRSAWP